MQAPPSASPSAEHAGFGPAFWVLNSIEMFERLAYFGVRVVIGVFIMQADDPGGLHLTAWHKGVIFGWWFIFQSILPMVTGGIADRYGFKRTMAFAIALNAIGYVLMAFPKELAAAVLPMLGAIGLTANEPSVQFGCFFASVMVLASGTAFFKPSLQGSLAQNLHKGNSSLGWGIFYWVVNVGGLIGPFVSALIFPADKAARTYDHWQTLFLCSAGFTCCNLALLFFFRDVPSGADKSASPLTVLARTFANILEPRLVCWLLIMSGFWLMMYQLWDLHPNFIEDWVDSRPLAEGLGWLPAGVYGTLVDQTDRGPQIKQQMLLNINAACIILLMIPVSYAVRRMRTLAAMLIGMSVATCGIIAGGVTMWGGVLAGAIVLFSVGEMLTGPKKNEYLGLIAPPGKKGLYLGYVNIPVGIGGYIGSKMAGYLYGHYGEKAVLAQRYIAENFPQRSRAAWDGTIANLEGAVGVKRPDAFKALMDYTGLDPNAATRLLWETYDPQYVVWLPFAVVGVVATLALAIFGQMAKRWKDMNA